MKWVGVGWGGGGFKGNLIYCEKNDDFDIHVQFAIAEFPNLKTQVKGVTVYF